MAWRNPRNKAGSGESRLGKVPKTNEVFKEGLQDEGEQGAVRRNFN